MEREEAAHHQSGPRQQDQRQCDLRRQQPGRPTAGEEAAAAAPVAVLQGVVDVRLRYVQGRREAKGERGRQAGGGDARHHATVHHEVDPIRCAAQLHRDQPDGESGQHGAGEAGGPREQHALHQQLPDEPPTGRAERHAQAHLPGSARRAGKQEIGHVRARDQEDEDGAAQQDENEPPVAVRGPLPGEGNDVRPDSRMGLGVLRGEPGGHDVEVGPGLLESHTVGQPAERPVVSIRSAERRLVRRPELDVARKPEPLGHHRDDDRRLVVHANRPADDIRVAAVAAHPERVREDRRAGGAVCVVLRQETAAEERRGIQEPERIVRDMGSEGDRRGDLVSAQVERRGGRHGDPVEGPVVVAPALEVPVRDPGRAPRFVPGAERHDALPVVTRKPREQDCVHHRVHGAGQRHPHAQHHDDGEREPAFLQQETPREAGVLRHAP